MRHVRFLVGLWSFVFACPVFAQSDQFTFRHNVRVYHQLSLLETSLTPADGRTVVMTYEFPEDNNDPEALLANETLLVFAEIQGIDANSEANTLFTSHIYLGTTDTYDDIDDASAAEITEGNGQNLAHDSDLLQDTRIKVGTYKIRASDVGSTPSRRFVNVTVRVDVAEGNDAQVNLQQSGSKLTIVRFTPLPSDTLHHGWFAPAPFEDADPPTDLEITSTDADEAQVIYVVDLAATESLSKNDIIIPLSEVQAKYTGSSMVYFNTQLRRSTSSSRTTSSTANDPALGRANRFSLKGGVLTTRTAVKNAAFQYASDGTANNYRYIKLVAWRGVSNTLDDRENDPNSEDGYGDPLVPVVIDPVDVGAGKLSVLRFRRAQNGQSPQGLDRLDQPEFNAPCGGQGQPSCYTSVEQVSTVEEGIPSELPEGTALFYQTLDSLTADEILLAVSEMEGTNEQSVIKEVYSRLVLWKDASPDPIVVGLSRANRSQFAQSTTHHGVSPKVGVLKTGTSSGEYEIRRLIWADSGFDGSCNPNSGCDQIESDFGRLGVLRFQSLTALNCTADCAGGNPSGPDGSVNTADLLAVINNWLQTVPLAGSLIDINDDGLINAGDLLQVINQWGPCPPAPPSSEGMPQSISDCFNTFCAGLEGEEWQNCMNKCIEAVCESNPSECE